MQSEYENPNILQGDAAPVQSSGFGSYLSIRCPHCGHLGIFRPVEGRLQYSKAMFGASKTRGFGMEVNTRICPNSSCMGIVFTVQQGGKTEPVLVYPPQRIDFSSDGLPKGLLRTFEEAVTCHAAGAYRASAMMVRRLLEEICDECGATGKDLHARLLNLRNLIILPNELFEAMSELKSLGNDAAHITAKSYSSIGKDEVEDSIELAKEILKARYQLKGLVDRLRARKDRENPTHDVEK